MKRTGPGDLAVPFAIVAVVVYVLLRRSYGSLPPIQPYAGVPIGVLAIAEWIASRRVRAAITHQPGAKPMQAIVIARCAALGKATALVGAGVVGATVGLLARVVPDASRVSAAGHDTRSGLILVVVSVALVVAGVLLERSAVDPGAEDRRP